MEFVIKDGKLLTDSPEGLPELNAFLGALETTVKSDQTWSGKFAQVVDAVRVNNLKSISIKVESTFKPPSGDVPAGNPFVGGGTLVHNFVITGD